MLSRQHHFLQVLGDARYVGQTDAVVVDAKQFMHHGLVCPLHNLQADDNARWPFIIPSEEHETADIKRIKTV